MDLCASVFDGARFRRSKGAVKIHWLLHQEGYLPHFAVITEGAVEESGMAHALPFDAGTIVVMDRGFTDYGLYNRWTEDGVFLVTRLKSNADSGVAEDRPIRRTPLPPEGSDYLLEKPPRPSKVFPLLAADGGDSSTDRRSHRATDPPSEALARRPWLAFTKTAAPPEADSSKPASRI